MSQTELPPDPSPTRSRPARGRRYWRNLALFALLMALAGSMFLVYVGHPYYRSRGWSHPRRLAVCCVTPADRGLAYEDVTLTTRDGLTLRGWYVPSQNQAAVILAHGMASNRIAVLDHAAMLARHGYGALLLDLRVHGESEGQVLPFGADEAEDVRAAALYLQGRPDVDPERIGALGLSLGAQVSLLAAARAPEVRAVVADGPCCTTSGDFPPPKRLINWLYQPYDWVFFRMLAMHSGTSNPTPLREALGQVRVPVLFIDGGDGYHIRYLAGFMPDPSIVDTWAIPEGGHVDGLMVRPQEYERRVVEFFEGALAAR